MVCGNGKGEKVKEEVEEEENCSSTILSFDPAPQMINECTSVTLFSFFGRTDTKKSYR
jgi:hypothetical protein